MAVDVSRIPNNNKFDPVREAILQLQTEIEDTGATIGNGTLTISTSSPLTGSGTFTANQTGPTSISIGIDGAEYLTNITHDTVNQKLVVTYGDGTTADLSLAQYIDDTNLARLVSGSLDNQTGIATFTRDDATTFTVDLSALFDDTDTNDFLTSASFSTANGIITFGVTNQNSVTVDIDGRYPLIGDLTAVSNDIITSADFSATDNRFKLTLTQADAGTIEASFDDVVLSESMAADYIPYVKVGGGDGDTTNAILNDSFLKINGSTLELDWGDTVGVYTARDIKMRKDGGGFGTYYEATYAADSVSFLHYASASDIDTAKIGATTTGRIRINDTYSLPAGDGTSGQVLSTNGSGDLSWVAAGGPTTSDLQDVTDNGATTTNSITVGGISSSGDVFFNSGGLTRIGNGGYDLFINGGVVFRDYADPSLTNGRIYYEDDSFNFRGGGEGEADGSASTSLKVRSGGVFHEVWHAGNDGAGSGLDADLLDGVEASGFIKVDTDNQVLGRQITLGDRTNSSNYSPNTAGLTLTEVAEVRTSSTDDPPALSWHYENQATRHILLASDGTLKVVAPTDENSGVADFAVVGRGIFGDIAVESGSSNSIRIGNGFGSGGTATIHNYLKPLYLQYNNGVASGSDATTYIGGGGTISDLNLIGGGNIVLTGRILMNRDGKSGDAINIDHVENSDWAFRFQTSSVGNDNASGFWVNSDGTPDMRLRRDDGTVRVLLHSNGTSYINGGNLVVNGTTTSYNFAVNGTSYISGNFYTGSSNYFGGLVRLTGTGSANSQLDLPIDYGALRWYNGSAFKGGIGTSSWSSLGSGNDLGFYLNTGTNFHIGAQSSEFVTFDSANQRVGIGTTTPAHKLHVAGNIRSEDTSTTGVPLMEMMQSSTQFLRLHHLNSGYSSSNTNIANSGLIVAGSGSTGGLVLRTDANAPIIFATNGVANERMRIGSNGYVGMGVANNNNQRLVLAQADSNGSQLRIQNTRTGGGYFVVGVGDSGSNSAITPAGGLFFYNGATRMVINSSGNVGIGTTSPRAKMSFGNVVDTNGYDIGTIRFYDNGADIFYGIGVSDSQFNLRAGTTSDGFAFWAGTSHRMQIQGTTGNVGIGTTSPSAKLNTNLSVEGSILAYLAGTAYTFDGDANIAVTHNSSTMGTGTAAGLLLANNNNSNNAISPLIAFSARSASNGYNHTYAAIYGQKRASGADSNWNRGDLIFATANSTGPQERMRILDGGNVGIGTTTPNAPLDVQSGFRAGRGWHIANRAGIRLDSNGTSYPSDILFGHTAAGNQSSWTGVYWSLSSRAAEDGNKFSIWRASGNPTGGSEYRLMTFDPNLRVGVANNSPVATLDVGGSFAITGQADLARINFETGGYHGIRFRDDSGTNRWKWGHAKTQNYFYLYDYAKNDSAFEAFANGNILLKPGSSKVGVNTTNPLENFHVSGTTISGAVGTTGTINRTGITNYLCYEARSTSAGNEPSIGFHKESVFSMYLQATNSPRGLRVLSPSNETAAGLYVQSDVVAYYSDMRLKTKIGDIQNPIGKIKSLNGFYYEPNEIAQSYGYEVERRIGLSAQDVKEVVPEAVSDAPIGDGYMAVDYAKLVPVLVEAIKEQQKQIDELKARLDGSTN